jgi:REP element-mobilizing transposase RayT
MTAPRQVLPGTTSLVTSRTSERRFFLRPSETTNAIVGYLLAVISERYGILLHAACVLSNHLHLVLTDPEARLPDFMRDFGSLLGRTINASLGHWDSIHERDSFSAVALETPKDVLAKMVYSLANPVAAGLVRRGREWPGIWSDPHLIGGEGVVFKRPEGFFREDGPMPATAVLRFRPPPGRESDPSFVAELLRELERQENRDAAELGKAGRSFLGTAKVRGQKWYARPSHGERRRGLSPKVACRNKWKRLEALAALETFHAAYREALAAWRKGNRMVVFPAGTWLMRVLHCAECADPP